MYYVTILLGVFFIWILVSGVLMISLRRTKRLAPGPFSLPIIGNLHLLGDKPHISLTQLAKTHGPIMNLKLGQINTVVISSSVLAKQVLQKLDLTFSNRCVPDALHACNHHDLSVIWLPVNNNSRWRTLRKIIKAHIFSGNKLDASEHLRTKKIQELIDYCRNSSKVGEAVDINRATFRTTLNLLSNTFFSKNLTDPLFDSAKELKELVWNTSAEGGKLNLVDSFPFLQKIDPQGIRRRMTDYFTKILHLMSDLVDERLKERSMGNHANVDVLDSLLNSPEEIDRNQIEHLCLDLFVAGTDTTSNTLEWAMAELLKNPHTLEKAQEELARVIGKGKLIDEADVTKLPYLRCIVKENFRIHPQAPFLIPRQVEEDVEFCGYIIPKDSQVLVNVWAIGRDSSLWEDPLDFKPERFWESEIDFRGQDFELIPFGSGRRICPGSPLAIRMVPVALGSLLNTFNWKLHGGIAPKDLDMEEKFGITLAKAQPLLAIPIPL